VVTALAFGGRGIVRHEGLVVFIPFTAVGDQIEFKILSKKKNYAEGELIQILKASHERITPRCIHFGVCGGCQLQHLKYHAQVDAKRLWVEEALKRMGGWEDAVVPPLIEAQSVWEYRRRVALHLEKGNIGYVAADHQTFFPVEECPIFVHEDLPILEQVRALVQLLECSGVDDGRVNLAKTPGDGFMLDFHFSSMPPNAEAVLSRYAEKVPLALGLLATAPGRHLSYGITEAQFSVEGLTFSYSTRTFTQNHPGQSALIYQELVQQTLAGGRGTVLDLYCGIGVSSLLLAREGVHVIGVESNPESIRLAQINQQLNKLKPVTFLTADVALVLPKLLKQERPQTVILNPPREGLEKRICEALVANPPERLLYVSCMPSTLARDLKRLRSQFQPVSVKAFDMFPQTTHVETLLSASRIGITG